MRLIIILSILSGLVFAERPREFIDIETKYLFVPVGFDSNDEITAILDGYLPNTCYRLTQPAVETTGKEIRIQPLAYLASGNCLKFPVPFTQEVHLGQREQGSYHIYTNSGRLTEQLLVRPARELTSVDDFNYAPVEIVEVGQRTASSGLNPAHFAVLKGRFPNTCLKLDKIDATTRNGKTVEVLPKMVLLSEEPAGQPCRELEVEFSASVDLPTLSLGRHLVHVRRSGGQAVNRVFTNLVGN